MKAAFCASLLFLMAMMAGCSSGGGSKSQPTVTVSSISVSPASMSIGMGAQQQFIATAHLSDGTTQDVTSTVVWSSSDSSVASIAGGGTATGSAPGTATITAQSGVQLGTATLTVSAAAGNLVAIAISPAALSMPVNTSQQFTATGSYSDGSTADLTKVVAWTSSSTATATIATNGMVTAVAAGTANISANFAGVSQSTALTVTAPSIASIAVTPVGLTLAIGINQQFVVTATYSDGSSAD